MQEPTDSSKKEQTFTQVVEPGVYSKKRSPIKKIFTIVSILALVTIAVGIYLLATGFMQVSFGDRSSSVASSSRVCKADTINRYNGFVSAGVKSEAEQNAVYENIKNLNNEIQSNKDAANDPTCLYIAFVVATNDRDADKANLYATQIEALANRGVFVDTRLVGAVSITQLKGTAQGLNTPQDDTQERG